jgi:hypothetical protein
MNDLTVITLIAWGLAIWIIIGPKYWLGPFHKDDWWAERAEIDWPAIRGMGLTGRESSAKWKENCRSLIFTKILSFSGAVHASKTRWAGLAVRSPTAAASGGLFSVGYYWRATPRHAALSLSLPESSCFWSCSHLSIGKPPLAFISHKSFRISDMWYQLEVAILRDYI